MKPLDTRSKTYLVDHWSPYMNFTCTMAQIKEWFLHNGERAWSHGEAWAPDYKRLCPGVYKVTFKRA